MNMTNNQIQKLALDLLHADSEDEVVQILKQAGLWENRDLWRLYGDKEGNFAQTGNQQSLPEAALVEKVVNCCDARLMKECLMREIDPESNKAPHTLRDAVAMFFESRRAEDDEAGTIANWPKAKRTEESRAMTVVATGDRPIRGVRTKKMCLTVTDQGEGQSPGRLPSTILSLNAKNKQRIRFVQGKFNMGGSGALRFCGDQGLQLVISRRHPELAARELAIDPTAADWAVTVVRREEPSNKIGEPVHSEFTYLAPIRADASPRKGDVLRFRSDTLPLMPEHDEPYVRDVKWGTAIKLYEYETNVGQSNILRKDGLLFALERLLPEIALPVRLHECRGYEGVKERSFETPLAGLVVRLEEGKGDNLEPGFPLSVQLRAAGMNMTARIYAFKEDKASTYLKDEGVIFAINGQAHGHLPKSIFTRPKAVGLPRLKDSLLVLVNCSALSARQREDLFMSSRDRLSKKPIRFDIECEIEQMLRTNGELRKLQQERREQDVKSRLGEEKPLEEVLDKVLRASPTLKTLFLRGQRLSRPFANGAGGNNGQGGGPTKNHFPFKGRRHPTYFKVADVDYGKVYGRNCEMNRRCRIKFETDVENEYFDRPTDRGTFELEIVDAAREMSSPSYSLALEDGEAHLNMALPPEAAVGDRFVLQATTNDSTLSESFVNLIRLMVKPKQSHPPGPTREQKRRRGGGTGEQPSQQGIALPNIILVREGDRHWNKYHFTADTACHVISDPIEVDGKTQLEHTFYINIDNAALKTEMKYSKQDARLLEAKFKYGNVLIGLAMLHEAGNGNNLTETGNCREDAESKDQSERGSVQEKIRQVSTAIAPVLLPIIDQLSGLNEEEIEVLGAVGEDD